MDVSFRCPVAGIDIQHWLEDVPSSSDRDSFESVECPACNRLHFINRSTGELVPENGNGGERSPPIVPAA
jgi:hypothetical protein